MYTVWCTGIHQPVLVYLYSTDTLLMLYYLRTLRQLRVSFYIYDAKSFDKHTMQFIHWEHVGTFVILWNTV